MRNKRTKVLSTKLTERDNQFVQLMAQRYRDNGYIKQARVSTLLRIVIKRFLRDSCPEYTRKLIASSYQAQVDNMYQRSEPYP
jgi:hypothetical protein